MKAYDLRNKYEETVYYTRCNKCQSEVEGELNEFRFISRFKLICKCPVCGHHNSLYAFQLHPRTIVKGIQQIEKLEV